MLFQSRFNRLKHFADRLMKFRFMRISLLYGINELHMRLQVVEKNLQANMAKTGEQKYQDAKTRSIGKQKSKRFLEKINKKFQKDVA